MSGIRIILLIIRSISLLLIVVGGTSCSIPFIGDSSKSTPTPFPDDLVTFEIPIYSKTMSAGDIIPATQMVYLGKEGPAYRVTIDGQEALKRVGDSFQWRGVIAPGIVSRYNLRISPTFSSSDMLAIGSVELNVLNPVPITLDNPDADASATIHFDNLKVDYRIPAGGKVPGTPFVYEAMTPDGARFGGIDGYPYRSLGDSLFWSGRLRGNLTANVEMRVASLSDESIRLVGTGELWISPAQ